MAELGRRGWWIVLASTVVVLAAVVLVWFQPQKLFIDDRVDEAEPTVATVPEADDGAATTTDPDPASGSMTTTVPSPRDLARGEFVSLDHATSGTARVIELADGSRFVRFEGFATENGPDLFVYLSTNPAQGPSGAFDDEFVNLGRLKGNLGDQNYALASDVPLDTWKSVVIWCDRFNSPFGAADLVSG